MECCITAVIIAVMARDGGGRFSMALPVVTVPAAKAGGDKLFGR
jgi:hypothetical protein